MIRLAPLVVQPELLRLVASNILTLCGGQLLEAGIVPIENLEHVGKLVGPKLEIGHLSRKLVGIQGNKSAELGGELLG